MVNEQNQCAYGTTRLPPGTRALVVEDQPFMAHAITDMVEALGGEVAGVAGTLKEALDAVADDGYTVALLDLDPDAPGCEPVAAAISARGKPFLVVTGITDRFILGFDGAHRLFQPVMQNQLERALLDLLTPEAGRA